MGRQPLSRPWAAMLPDRLSTAGGVWSGAAGEIEALIVVADFTNQILGTGAITPASLVRRQLRNTRPDHRVKA
jgi:hypothetical protein